MMNNPIHRERSEDTQISRSIEEIESTELDSLLKEYPEYEPSINGYIGKEFVDVTSKIQYVTKLNGERGKTRVADRIVDARKKRITESDRECAEKARDKVYCGDKNICEDAIQRYGDEIIATMKCVSILNAPQTYADHQGEGKLYFTKRKNVITNEKDVNKPKESYRLYYYSYGENPIQRSVEKTSDIFEQTLQMLEENICLKVRTGSKVKVATDDQSHRDTQGVFVSLALEDLVAVHHRVSDTTEMKKFVASEANFYKEVDCLNCQCACLKLCTVPFIACVKCCSVCSCSLTVDRTEAKHWEWMLKASQNLDSLTQVVSGASYSHSYEPEALVYNPLEKKDIVMATTTSSEVHWRRYHTVNFTYLDRTGDGHKHRCVLVMDPQQDTKEGIDLVCRLTALLNADRGFGTAPMDSRDPLRDHGYLLRTNPTATDLLSDTLLGNIDIHIEVSYYYRINNVWVIVLCLIGLCVSFAAVTVSPYLILNGLYSTVQFLDRVYNFRQKDFNRNTVLKDLAYAAAGLLFTIIGGATLKEGDVGAESAIAFTFLQGLFAFIGTAYQLFNHYQGKTASPLFETGTSMKISGPSSV